MRGKFNVVLEVVLQNGGPKEGWPCIEGALDWFTFKPIFHWVFS